MTMIFIQDKVRYIIMSNNKIQITIIRVTLQIIIDSVISILIQNNSVSYKLLIILIDIWVTKISEVTCRESIMKMTKIN